ncbi:hypothetical protein ACFFQW_41875 [Umezawaea endophytica]|uniref:Uncharacterized protein n=1 Tax=Umezawaea endophytica TaxID=1654476 RepID=A0A9X2VF33_9PSEU|nr:hypothetical protein [Umezawaea endophytica]MCS7475325.1 hypothetical protein [Umezawaea endophytica]
MTSEDAKALRAGLISALATAAAGFGAMTAFAFTAPSSVRHLPDLWSYQSATWGDGILLPLSCGALVYSRAKLTTSGLRGVTVAAAVAGGLLGLATQALWLLDDDPRLNWTLPEPHHFTTAGVYHGMYLVTMSAVFAALWTSVLCRARAAVRNGDDVDWPSVSGGAGLAVCSGIGFAALVVADNQVSSGSSASTATLAAIGTALACALGTGLVVLRILRQRRRLRR